MNKAPTRDRLSIRGSSKTVAEFFEYSINTILYQRGIYPADDFQQVKKYGINVLVTVDSEVKAYIRKIMGQLHKWLVGGKIQKLIVAITSKESGEAVERWQFDIHISGKDTDANGAHTTPDGKVKTDEQIHTEIQAIMRQITASVSFLPVLEEECTFNVLVYAEQDAPVPPEWADSANREIKNPEQVQLRSFSTNEHKIDTLVAYRLDR
ncbi:Mitotic spindle checkpoint component mad2 [Yarrowia sp. C11]|nr:Mitotic spindle checkpoint component mad2 [Yarrowia sp. E02]KAG5371876.1 Mitotic spindle checkpoint component mad2 [Yarrowia sp. C11]